MEELNRTLSSPVWWVSVVFAGLILNIMAVYIKSGLDSLMSMFSAQWRARVLNRKVEDEKYIQHLASNPDDLVLETLRELRMRIRGLSDMLFCLFFVGIYIAMARIRPESPLTIMMMFFAVVTMLVASKRFISAGNELRCLIEARKRSKNRK